MSLCDSVKKLHCHAGWGLLVARVFLAVAFLLHAVVKFQFWSQAPEGMSSNMVMLMKFLSIVEPLGAIALLIGFLTQFAAMGLGIIMLGAVYFKQFVWGVGFISATATGWEYDAALFVLCFILAIAGPGKLAVDWVMCKKFCNHSGKASQCVDGCCCKE